MSSPTNMDDKGHWIHSVYLPQLTGQFDTSMTYLHTTLNWAITAFLGVIAVVLARSTFPDRLSYVMLLILLVMLGHFAVRTGKAYLNVVRWTTLERHILKTLLDQSDVSALLPLVEKYHYAWVSPLSLKHLAFKILFELGFVYFAILNVGLLVFVWCSVGWDWWMLLELCGALMLLGLEIWVGLLRSPYLRKIEVDPLARKLR